jgi:tellurite methyltransferase
VSRASIEPHPARERWNKRFAEGGFEPFPDDPAEWLVEHRELLRSAAPGRALDVACGNGRNALYLARQGFDVEAVDISDYAIDRLRAAAAERALPITPRRADLEDDPLPVGQYELIVNVNYLQRDLFGPLGRALKPGGLLFFETVSQAHLEEAGGCFNPRYALGPNELLQAFSELFVCHYREGVVRRRGTERGVASLVARRLA